MTPVINLRHLVCPWTQLDWSQQRRTVYLCAYPLQILCTPDMKQDFVHTWVGIALRKVTGEACQCLHRKTKYRLYFFVI